MPRPSRTNLEVEIKLRISEPGQIREVVNRLRQLGASRRECVLEQNTLYDTPSADFRRSGRLLRLRTETTSNGRIRALMTANAPPPPDSKRPAHGSRYKERLERETTVRDSLHADRLLKFLGLRPSFRYEKYRTGFDLPGLHIALDETPVGTFLELEGRRAAIDRVARALGFTSNDYFRGTYWDLYAADCRRKGRKPGNMLFSRKNPR